MVDIPQKFRSGIFLIWRLTKISDEEAAPARSALKMPIRSILHS